MAKYGLTAELGQRTSKGTLITEKIQAAAAADMEGLEVIADNTEEVLAALDSAIGRALEEIGLVAEGYAKRLAPVDTGRLRNSITHTIDASEFWCSVILAGNQTRFASVRTRRMGPRVR